METKNTIYISGAISGLNYENVVDKFKKAEDYLTGQGYAVFNPLKNGLDKNFGWEQHMAVDLATLMECDSIYILNDALHSRGARIEMSIALERGMIILFEDKDFMLDSLIKMNPPTYIKTLILLLLSKSYKYKEDPLCAKRYLIESELTPRALCPMCMHIYLPGETTEKNPFIHQIHEVLYGTHQLGSNYDKALKAGQEVIQGLQKRMAKR